MPRYLVVANQTLGGNELVSQVRKRLQAGSCSFYIVVPATPPRDQLTWTEGEALVIAESRLEDAKTTFKDLGAEVDGEVGDGNPVDAIKDVLSRHEFDEVIVSTFPPGLSRWLGQDLPHRVERNFGLPVTHVVTEKT